MHTGTPSSPSIATRAPLPNRSHAAMKERRSALVAVIPSQPSVHTHVRVLSVVVLMLLALTAPTGPALAASPDAARSIGAGAAVGLMCRTDTPFCGLTITPDGTSATITFTTNAAVRAGASYAIASAATADKPIVNASIAAQPIAGTTPSRASVVNGAGFTGFVTLPGTSHLLRLTGLKSNTVYVATIWLDNGAGQQTQSTAVTFHTPKRRIRITFPKATITDYAQLIGNPDAVWLFNVRWAGGELGTCYPYSGTLCQPGDTGDADNFNQYFFTNAQNQVVGYLFREEDFGNALPTAFTVGADAQASSWTDSLTPFGFAPQCADPLGCPDAPYTWTPPQDGTSTVQTVNVRAEDSTFGFKSTVQVKLEVFYDDLSYSGSKTVTDPVGGKTVVSLFT